LWRFTFRSSCGDLCKKPGAEVAVAITVNLNCIEFRSTAKKVLELGRIRVSAFCFDSGVKALRIENGAGFVVALPFHGQQIWDAEFHGRRLTMGSMFNEPLSNRDYLGNYGGFLLHCGATAMGNPGPGDSHPLHGELPNAPYQSATLSAGSDERGEYVELAGEYEHIVAFSTHYRALPTLRIHANSGRMTMHMRIENLKMSAMDFMYLAHVNFRPVDGARLIDTVKTGAAHVRLRTKIPEFFAPSAAHAELVRQLQIDPDLHREIVPGRAIDPELVMGLDFSVDEDGWAHSMQLLPDGSADFISHQPTELLRGIRWMTRTGDQEALGLFMPGTAEADGYSAEKAKGNVRVLGPGEAFSCSFTFGALDRADAQILKDRIASLP
jgi:hypothetical protein